METGQYNWELHNEILSKIPNGKELYNTSAMFNKVVNHLSYGADPILIIGQLLAIIDNKDKAFDYIYKKSTE